MTQSERGDYRAIRQSLLDDPAFQKLSERARFAFITIKIGSGPTGLNIEYELGLVEKVAFRTGMGVPAAKKAVLELENSGWIEREGPVIRIHRHLQDEPNMRPTDGNHRKSIQRYVAGLPRLPIIRRFIAAHPEWFPDKELQATGLGWTLPEGPVEGPPKGPASTSNQQPATNYQQPATDVVGEPGVPAAAPTPAPSDFAAFGPLRSQLPTDADRDALDTMLAIVDSPRTWVHEMVACLDGMGGHTPLTPELLAQALRDFVGNGAHRRKSMREFRAYLADVVRPPDERKHRSTNGTGGRIERGRAALARFAGGTDGE